MNAIPKIKPSTAKIIEVALVEGKLKKKSEVEYNKGSTISKNRCHKVAGVSSEVYPFVSEEEIKAMIDAFDNKVDNAPDDDKRRIALRNKMLFVLGINLSLRASDLCGLKYSFFMNEDGSFKEHYSLQPKKTRKTGKFVKLFFNQAVKNMIAQYLNEYPVENLDEYLFKSRVGDGCITEKSLGRIIKETAAEVGIDRNINSHSLRKSFGYHVWHNAEDKEKALVMLMTIFNHSSVVMTKKYIGLMDNEIEDIFNELNLGLDYLE